jgi:hypothetical protein
MTKEKRKAEKSKQERDKEAERRGWAVNTLVLYSGGPGSNLGPETGYTDWGF